MRKSLWIILAVMVVAVGAPNAHADSFSVTFTCETIQGSCPPPTAPDVTFPSPALDVTYNGLAFTFTPLHSSSLPTDSYNWSSDFGCTSPTTCTASVFMANSTNGDSVGDSIPNLSDRTFFIVGEGSVTFTPVTTAPEPASLLLLGTGLLGVAGIKRRRSGC